MRLYDPCPETIGLASLMIDVPHSFQGDAEISWHLTGRTLDEDMQRITCDATALLQGVFCDVRGNARPGAVFDARVIANVVHAFYRARIEAAWRLEEAYQWRLIKP